MNTIKNDITCVFKGFYDYVVGARKIVGLQFISSWIVVISV